MARRRYRRSRRRDADGAAGLLVLLFAGWIYTQYFRYQILVSSLCGLLAVTVFLFLLYRRRASAIRKYHISTGLHFYHDFTPIQFEHVVAELFKLQGYSATVTPASGDKGIDVFVRKKDQVRAIQCKHYNPEDAIGPDTVREFAGALDGAGINKGWIIATCLFTNGAYQTAKSSRFDIGLVDIEQLGEWQTRLRKNKTPATAFLPFAWWTRLPPWQKQIVLSLIILNVFIVTSGLVYLTGFLAGLAG